MRRREFISLLGGVAAAWPIFARAQRLERMRRIGVLMGAANDSQGQALARSFEQELDRLGWTIGQNVLIDYRWGARDDPQQARIYAAELIALAPDAVVPQGSQNSEALQKETQSIPIIFVEASDPMSSGLVSSMSKPGRNLTGFTNFEFSIGSKWLEILRELAPEIRRALVLEGLDIGNQGFLRSENRDLIVALAARYHLPAMYSTRPFVASGGLMSYDTDTTELWRQAASYVDRILRGENPGDLPVQVPTKYELVINLKTARGIGLHVPATLLARADEVIE
jgi:putative tryptophan/tyrosine transport system substrate-binding protein